MKTKRLALAAVVVLVLLGLAIVLTTIRSAPARPSPAFTVRCSKVALFRDGMGVSVEISNHTTRPYSVRPLRMEWLDGGIWTECQNGIASFTETGDLGPHGNAKIFCPTKNLPRGKPLRLIMQSSTPLTALNSFVERARLRLSGRSRNISLNPLDKKVVFYRDAAELGTEEFVAP